MRRKAQSSLVCVLAGVSICMLFSSCKHKMVERQEIRSNLFTNIVKLARNFQHDSITTDSVPAYSAPQCEMVLMLNREFSTKAFFQCKGMQSVRIFNKSSTWGNSVSLLFFQGNAITAVEQALHAYKGQNLSFEQWNRFSWHCLGDTLVFIETYEPVDTVFRIFNTFLYEKYYPQGNQCSKNDSMFLAETLVNLLTNVTTARNPEVTLKNLFHVETIKNDTDNLLCGYSKNNELRWTFDTVSQNQICIGVATPSTLDFTPATVRLKGYLPDIVSMSSNWKDGVKCRYNYFGHSARIIKDSLDNVRFIAFFLPKNR